MYNVDVRQSLSCLNATSILQGNQFSPPKTMYNNIGNIVNKRIKTTNDRKNRNNRNNQYYHFRYNNHYCFDLFLLLLSCMFLFAIQFDSIATLSVTSEDILTNRITINDNQQQQQQQIITYLTRTGSGHGSSINQNHKHHHHHHNHHHHHSSSSNANNCPKWLNCTEAFFDEGKDCHDAGSGRSNSISNMGTGSSHSIGNNNNNHNNHSNNNNSNNGIQTTRCNCIAHCCLAFDCRDWGHLVQCRRKCGAPPNRFGLRRSDRLDCAKYHCDRHHFDVGWDARGATDSQRNCVAHCCFAFDCRRSLGYCRHACGVDAWVTARPLG